MPKKKRKKLHSTSGCRTDQTASEWQLYFSPQVDKFFRKHDQYAGDRELFASDVTTNPYYCEARPKRIIKLHGYPPSTYRWRRERRGVRVIYEVVKTTRTVLALAADIRSRIYDKR